MAINNHEKYSKIQVLEDPIVEYKDGRKELFTALHITNEGIYTGHIITESRYPTFVGEGGISKNSIARIVGGTTRQVYQK